MKNLQHLSQFNDYEIYTGYKWRTLKDYEFEILEPSRVLAHKPKEPIAGDVVRKTASIQIGKYKFGGKIEYA